MSEVRDTHPGSDANPSAAGRTTVDGEWVEEGLFFRGPTPPSGRDWNQNDWVEIPHESYIAVPKVRINEALGAQPQAREAGQRFDDFLRILDGLYHFYHHETLNQLKQDYQFFSPDGGELTRQGATDEELVFRERRFVGNFMKTMVLGNFLPFSSDDYRRAVEQEYLLDVPVEIDWKSHDKALIDGFLRWADGDDAPAQQLRQELGVGGSIRDYLSPPDEVDTNAIVFYRGIERDQAEGRFLMQRVDIAFTRALAVITFPVVAPIRWMLDKLRGVRTQKQGDESRARTAAEQGDEATRSTVFERRWVRRKNLHNQPVLRGFFKPTRLQEPMLRQVIILFRLAAKPRPALLARKTASEAAANGETKDWTIHLKMFRHIPLADSEIVFPEKKIRMGSFDLAVLIISALAAIPAVFKAIQQGGGAAMAVATGLVLYMSKVVGRYMRVRSKYIARMTKNLYEKNLDNSVGVLQYLVDSLEEQEYKEAALVYFVLWREGQPMTAPEIDAAVERFIAEQFGGLEIDFEVDDALAKVVESGESRRHVLPIVEVVPGEGDEPLYQAKPLDDVLEILDGKWDNLFQYHQADTAA